MLLAPLFEQQCILFPAFFFFFACCKQFRGRMPYGRVLDMYIFCQNIASKKSLEARGKKSYVRLLFLHSRILHARTPSRSVRCACVLAFASFLSFLYLQGRGGWWCGSSSSRHAHNRWYRCKQQQQPKKKKGYCYFQTVKKKSLLLLLWALGYGSSTGCKISPVYFMFRERRERKGWIPRRE